MTTEIKWADRKILHLPTNVMKKLVKGKRAHMLKQGQWYELIPNGKITVKVAGKVYKVTEEKAKQITKALSI